MAFPNASRIEVPILQELVATGGKEDVRFLYERLIAYFPQPDEPQIDARQRTQKLDQWKRFVQRAGRALDEKHEIQRDQGQWSITALGRTRVGEEELHFSITNESPHAAPTDASAAVHADASDGAHRVVQQLLLDIGRVLGYYAESEFEYYDVVWRTDRMSPRISHVFEVQHKGNIDAALAKLKRAYDAQRTRPFLIVASEQDTNRARKSLSATGAGAFHEIGAVTKILSFAQLRKLHRALISVEDLLAEVYEG